MKLIYVANIRFPIEKAHGIQIVNMCSALVGRGAEVELIIPTRDNPDFENVDPFEYYGIEKNFKITKLRTADPAWLMRLWEGLYIKVQAPLFIWKLHSYLSGINLENTMLYTRDEYLLPILQRFASQNRGLTQTGTRTNADREESKGAKVIWEAHNLPTKKEYYKKYWRKCHRIIAISKGLKNELLDLGVSEGRILIAPDGVDLEKFKVKNEKLKIREKLGLPIDKKIVMYTGHLYDWKGASVLLEVAKRLSIIDYRLPVIFVFVGGTEQGIKSFKAAARGLDNVLILGHKPPSEIPKYLAAADVLVLPTSGKSDIGKKYTSPMKLFEYMASQKPIVASDLPSIRELLNESNAVLVKPDDIRALAEGIKTVLRNPELAAKISEQAYQDVRQFTWEKRAQKIKKIFE